MKLGTIKIESLKLMFANNDDELTIDNKDNILGGSAALDLNEAALDSQYRDYLNNMNGSINRCFTLLESKKILPKKRITLISPASSDQINFEYDLSTVIDLDEIDRIVVQRNDRIYDSDYLIEGSTLILPYVEKGDVVRMIYYPLLTRLTQTSDNTADIPIPDKIAVLIPYYVKYDLFREDSESEANESLGQFMRMLEMITNTNDSHQTSVDNVIDWR